MRYIVSVNDSKAHDAEPEKLEESICIEWDADTKKIVDRIAAEAKDVEFDIKGINDGIAAFILRADDEAAILRVLEELKKAFVLSED